DARSNGGGRLTMAASPLIALALGATLASPSDLTGAAGRMARWIFGNDVAVPKLELSGGQSGRGSIVLKPSQSEESEPEEEAREDEDPRSAERAARQAAREAERAAREAQRT